MLKIREIGGLFPGLILSLAVTVVALAAESAERTLLGFAWIDSLVIAILLGTSIHTGCGLPGSCLPGIGFAAKTLLELAIVLLGASVSAAALGASGWVMPVVVAGVVFAALVASYAVSRLLGLGDRLALLVACGNSICGNSAIVAAAPVIDAETDEIAASIAFTAALGILVVLLLPVGFRFFAPTQTHYGIVAGMTVYAVPQVLAATVPAGTISTQIGTLVKLMRVLMLGPVILTVGLLRGGCGRMPARPGQLVPWFILGFAAMAAARSFSVIPQTALAPLKEASTVLTLLSMAALGLSVNLRTVLSCGGRVLAAGFLSILMLLGFSIAALHIIPPG